MYDLKAEGAFAFTLSEETVERFESKIDIPKNTDGRAVDTAASMTVTGKIRSAGDGGIADSTIQAAQWANNMNDSQAYQNTTATATAAGQVLRRTTLPNAFVVGYSESFNVASGVGSFELKVRQKKDLLEGYQIEGGFGL